MNMHHTIPLICRQLVVAAGRHAATLRGTQPAVQLAVTALLLNQLLPEPAVPAGVRCCRT